MNSMISKKNIIIGVCTLIGAIVLGMLIPICSDISFKVENYGNAVEILENAGEDVAALKKNSNAEPVLSEDKAADTSASEAQISEDVSLESTDDTQSTEVPASEELLADSQVPAAELSPDAIIFDWKPEDITFLGKPLQKGIYEELCEEYGFVPGMQYATKDFEDGYEINESSSSYTHTVNGEEQEVIQNSISVHDPKYEKVSISYSEEADRVYLSISIMDYSKTEELKDIIAKVVNVPFDVGKDEDIERVFHVRKIIDKYDFKDVSGLPFESNLKDTRISEYQGTSNYSGKETDYVSKDIESHSYQIYVGNFYISLYSNEFSDGYYRAYYEITE